MGQVLTFIRPYISPTMSFPDLPPIHRDAFEPGNGDEIEDILLSCKIGALGKLLLQPEREMNDIVREDLEKMLKRAEKKKDEEFIKKFKNAIARLSRID